MHFVGFLFIDPPSEVVSFKIVLLVSIALGSFLEVVAIHEICKAA